MVKKFLVICSFLTFSFSFVSAATTEQNQQSAMQQMNETENVFGTLQKRVEDDYNKAKSSFDNAVEQSNQKAVEDRKNLDSKFDKMKNDFDKSAPKGTEKSTSNGIDMFPERRTPSNNLNLRERPATQQSNNGDSKETMKVTGEIEKQSSQKVGKVDVQEESPASSVSEKENSTNQKNLHNTITTNPSTNSSEFSISKENFVKFVIISLILFIVMAILYFNGKRKEEM